MGWFITDTSSLKVGQEIGFARFRNGVMSLAETDVIKSISPTGHVKTARGLRFTRHGTEIGSKDVRWISGRELIGACELRQRLEQNKSDSQRRARHNGFAEFVRIRLGNRTEPIGDQLRRQLVEMVENL